MYNFPPFYTRTISDSFIENNYKIYNIKCTTYVLKNKDWDHNKKYSYVKTTIFLKGNAESSIWIKVSDPDQSVLVGSRSGLNIIQIFFNVFFTKA